MFSPFQSAPLWTLGQRRLNETHNNTLDRQFDLKEQQRRLVDDESRATAEVSGGESAYALASYLFCSSPFTVQ